MTPADLARLGAVTSATGWKVDLGPTLGHPHPAAAAAEASAARQLVGDGLAPAWTPLLLGAQIVSASRRRRRRW